MVIRVGNVSKIENRLVYTYFKLKYSLLIFTAPFCSFNIKPITEEVWILVTCQYLICLETYLVWYLYQDNTKTKVLKLGGKGDSEKTMERSGTKKEIETRED